jgi:acyl-coenzyme A thioesterase PaaI-like protein
MNQPPNQSLNESTYPPDDHVMRDLRLWTERDETGSRSHVEVTPWILTSLGFLRAGVMATLADMAGGEGAVRAVRPNWVATSDLVLHSIRPVADGVVVARPQVLRQTRSTVVIEVGLAVADESVGLATMTFAVLEARSGVQRMGTGREEPRTDFGLPGSGLTMPLEQALEVETIDAPRGIVELPIRPWVGNSLGALQGGVVAMTIELAAEAAGREALGADVTILDLGINYLSLVRTGPARTSSRLLRQSDNEALLRIELRDMGSEARLCTVATTLVRV